MSSLQSEILGEDFDNLLQYSDPTPPQGKTIDKTTLKQSTVLPQLYHHGDLHHGLHSGAVSTEPPSLSKGALEAKQLFCDLQPKTSAKCDSVLPLDVPKTSTKRDNIFIEDGASQKELWDRFSASVDADFASCNNHNLSYMSYEASQVLPSDCAACTFGNNASVGIENMSPAVQLDLQGDSETTTADCGNCDGDDHASRDEVGSVDLDSSASKELADLFLELRRNLLKEEGADDGNRVLVKGMVKIGEIDEFTEDGLPLDFEELDQNAHQLSSSM